MITFLICLTALVVAYFTYGRYLEKVCEVNSDNPVPSKTHYDGVDYIPLPRWRIFLIQLLNIAVGFICGVAIIFAGTTDEANANAFSSRFSYKYKNNSSFN